MSEVNLTDKANVSKLIAVMTSTRTGTPIYDALWGTIRQDIQSGRLKPGERIGSEHALVRSTGLSRNSVRRAVDRLVSEGLVVRRPGRGLFVRRADTEKRTIQVVVPDISLELYVRLTRSIQRWGYDNGVSTQVYDAHGRMDKDIAFIRNLPDSSVDGAIICSLFHPSFTEAVFELKMRGFPFVLIGQQPEEIEVTTVVADNYKAGYMVGRELIGMGHRRAAFIGALKFQPTRRRLDGLRDAFNDADLAFDRSMILDLGLETPMDNWEARLVSIVRDVLDDSSPPTALVCGFGSIAVAASKLIKEAGLIIPSDISLVCFDDDPQARCIDPPIATVRQPAEEMGLAATELLLQVTGKPKGTPTQHRVLPVEWIARESLAPVRAGRQNFPSRNRGLHV